MDIESGLSRLPIRKITVTLSVVSALFAVVGLVSQVLSPGEAELYTWTHMFDLDAEAAAPAWYQTGLLLVCAGLLWVIGSSRRPNDALARYFRFLGWVLVYLSADENAAIHETLGFWIANHFGHAMGVYAWLIPGIAFVIYMTIISWKNLKALPPATRRGMILAAVVYVVGAAGFDLIESRLDYLWGTLSFSMLTVVEESLEMAGLVIFIHTLLSYIRSLPQGPTLAVEP